MRNAFYKYIPLIFGTFFLLWACSKEHPGGPEEKVTATLDYTLTVEHGMGTRATFNGDAPGSGAYVFSEGDKLYVSGADGNMYGVLALISGAGTGSGTFNGSLTCLNGFVPDVSTEVTATLVGSGQDEGFYTIADNKISGGPDYPVEIPYDADFKNYVSAYSHFTAAFPYNVRRMTLSQHTVFLDFNLRFYRAHLSGTPGRVTVSIKDADGTVLRTVSNVPLEGNAGIGEVHFSTLLPAGTDLGRAQIWINDEVQCPGFSDGVTLAADKYYRVSRPMDPFTIKARELGANVTFNYVNDGIQYRKNGGEWTSYTSKKAIALGPGETLSFRGKRTGYGGIFTSDNPVYVYGDLMSLVCDANYEPLRSLTATTAFKESFKDRTNVDIDPEKELILSAETIGSYCYQAMFQGCTSLTKAPIIAATSLGEGSCESMFLRCTALRSAPSALLAEEVPPRGYRYMFEGCTSLTVPPDMSKMKTVESGNWNSGTNSDSGAKNTFGGCLRMFNGCKALTSLPDLSGLRSVDGYGMYEMFFQCTGLTSVPAGLLSGVTEFKQGCFFGMFEECSNLVSVGDFLPKPASGDPYPMAKECYRQVFKKCTKLSSVPSDFLPATTLAELCYTGMFEQCKALVSAPNLPAETMVSKCYEWMFENCSSLTSIRCLATNYSGDSYTKQWLQNAKNTAECTFYKKRGANWNRNIHGIPDKWNVVEVD